MARRDRLAPTSGQGKPSRGWARQGAAWLGRARQGMVGGRRGVPTGILLFPTVRRC